ncbi:MAG: hypothetical protein KL787_09870 [Taibaiella sp.]|nr:hypothetical protein [Taibaiella sp.]
MKTSISRLITFILLLTCTAQVTYGSDTLLLNFTKYDPETSAGFNFVTAQDYLTFSYKVRYADSTRFAAKEYEDSHWHTDQTWKVKNEDGRNTYWYRFKLKAGPEYVNYPFVMIMDGEGALEVYIDGALQSTMGKIPPDHLQAEAEYVYLSEYPVILSFKDTGTYQVAIRYKSNIESGNDGDSWFAIRTTDVSSYLSEVKSEGIFTSIAVVGIGTVFLSLFLVHLLFFLFYRKDKANLLFAIFTLSISIVMIACYVYIYAESLQYDDFFSITINIVPIISCFTLCTFISYIFSKNKTRDIRILVIAYALALIFAVFDYLSIFDLSAVLIWIVLVGTMIYTIFMIIKSMISRLPGSFILGSGVLYFLLFLFILLIIVLIKGNFTFNTTVSYLTLTAIFSIPLSISAYLAWRFSTTSMSLSEQIKNVEQLSLEKQNLLESQNERLEQQVAKRTQELKEEKQKSEELLLNILPHEVAEELKEKGSSKAQYYDEVSVIFTDFVNFTAHSEKLGAEAMLQELNECFTAFDLIMEKHGLEKIKTIGDAYLAVSGLPILSPHHAEKTILAALDILNFVRERKLHHPHSLDIRIGIHSGPLIAGIVGVKKFAYDIWGDTVNTAARMEQNSIPGRINISQETYRLVQDTFTFEPRGKINVKGKGELEMYFVIQAKND